MDEVVVGIDIGGTVTKFGLVTKTGKVVLLDRMPTTGFDGFNDYFKTLVHKISVMTGKMSDRVTGIGIGAPMGNFLEGSIDMATNLGWGKKIMVARTFSEFFNKPAFLTNDATAAAIGEKTGGVAKNMDDWNGPWLWYLCEWHGFAWKTWLRGRAGSCYCRPKRKKVQLWQAGMS